MDCDIFSVTGLRILRVLSQKGRITYSEVCHCATGALKHTPTQIYDAVRVELNIHERKLLAFLLDKYERTVEDLNTLVDMLREVAAPYKTALEQIDSIPGFDEIAALLVLAEITDKPNESFASSEQLCSWAGLVPRNDESAGKVKSNKILKGSRYLKPILCQCVHAAKMAKKSPYRDWYWSHVKRLGKQKTIIAIARKLLSVVYAVLRDNTCFNP